MRRVFTKFFGEKHRDTRVITPDDSSDWRGRAPRVQITPLHRIGFQPRAIVFNISMSGIGFIRKSVSFPVEIGGRIDGKVSIAGESFPVHLNVARISETTVGCEFSEVSSELPRLKEAIEKYFQIELAALSMMKPDSKGDAYRIRGQQCDLYYVVHGGQVAKFRMAYLGNRLEAEKGRTLAFGSGNDDSVGRIPDGQIAYAIKFLENIPHLQGDLRRQMISMVESARR